MDIKNKVAIITGGASGLGKATAQCYVNAGAKVAIFDMDDEQGNVFAQELGDNAIFQNVDVTDEEMVINGIRSTIDAFGAMHVCNNFAGINHGEKTVSKEGPHTLDNFKKVIAINLTGTFNVSRLAANQMANQAPVTEDGTRGVIIHTASVAAYEGQIGQTAYSASKGGIVGMTIAMARDLASLGIRVNALAPGIIHTPLFDALSEKVYTSLESSVLYPPRLGIPEEVARTSLFIVENDYMNGETIRVDGGIRMQAR